VLPPLKDLTVVLYVLFVFRAPVVHLVHVEAILGHKDLLNPCNSHVFLVVIALDLLNRFRGDIEIFQQFLEFLAQNFFIFVNIKPNLQLYFPGIQDHDFSQGFHIGLLIDDGLIYSLVQDYFLYRRYWNLIRRNKNPIVYINFREQELLDSHIVYKGHK
jgi:hypothetical protein